MLIKYALRNIKKRPLLNLIKVVGLSLGLSGILFIALFLKNEMAYDTFHKKAERIYRLTITSESFLEGNHFARIINSETLPELSEELPEIDKIVRLMPLRDGLVLREERNYSIDQAFAVDDTFFEIFDAVLLKGDQSSVLTSPGSTVISESFALKVFGDEDPIGKTFSLPKGHFNLEKMDLTIHGVFKDFSQGSHFHPNLLVIPGPDKISGWSYAYVLLRQSANPLAFEEKVSRKFTDRYSEGANNETAVNAHLTNIREIHLNSNLLREIEPNGSMTGLYVFSIAALILLFISLSNFANLSLGMAGYLRKFLALNRILGSSRRFMVSYFFIESFILVMGAIFMVLLICIPVNSLIFENYQINLLQGNAMFTLAVILLFGLCGILAGVQPIINNRFENFTLGESLKGGNFNRHKFMLISQFVMAIVLLVGVMVISKQTSFALKNSMGAGKDNLVCIPSVHSEMQKEFKVFKSELLEQNAIVSVSAMMDSPGGETHDMFPYTMQDAPEVDSNGNFIGVFACDYSFADVFSLTFLSGRNFNSNNFDEIEKGEYVINETALNYLGFQDPNEVIGKAFAVHSPVEGVSIPKGRIIGVVKDFHLSGLQTKVEPLVLFKREDSWLGNIVIAYRPSQRNEAMEIIDRTWSRLFPEYPLEYLQVSAMYENVYKSELLQRNFIIIFSIVSIFVCAMGLIGISLMVSQRRFKEIGIRKVNGAKISEILLMLNRDFFIWLTIALILAAPLALLAANKWLEAFAYKIDVSIWMIVLAFVMTTLITIITVSWHGYKAARQNPANSLRTE